MTRTITPNDVATIESNTATINYNEFVGDSILLEFGWCDEETELPHNLSGYSAVLEVHGNSHNPELTLASSNGDILLNHDLVNKYNIKTILTDEMTTQLGAGTFHYQLKLTDPDNFVNTLVIGNITLTVR